MICQLCSQLNPGDVVFNSSNSIHLDPQYWPDPLTYNPDRWSDENKHNIKPFTYQPFGLGPRICIGNAANILFSASSQMITA